MDAVQNSSAGFYHGLSVRTMLFEPLCKSETVIAMPLHSERERFDALQIEERLEWRQAGSDITQCFNSELDCESDGTECFVELKAMVAWRGLCEAWEFARLGPVEFASINDHAAVDQS